MGQYTGSGRAPTELTDCLVLPVRRDGRSLMFREAATLTLSLSRGAIPMAVAAAAQGETSGRRAWNPGISGPSSHSARAIHALVSPIRTVSGAPTRTKSPNVY